MPVVLLGLPELWTNLPFGFSIEESNEMSLQGPKSDLQRANDAAAKQRLAQKPCLNSSSYATMAQKSRNERQLCGVKRDCDKTIRELGGRVSAKNLRSLLVAVVVAQWDAVVRMPGRSHP